MTILVMIIVGLASIVTILVWITYWIDVQGAYNAYYSTYTKHKAVELTVLIWAIVLIAGFIYYLSY